jgi:hypothetical protein
VVTLGALSLTIVATAGRPTSRKPYLVVLLAGVMLLNVLIPHLPAAVAFGGYAPGVVTAVLINAPVCLWFLRRPLRERHVGRRGLALTVVASMAALLPGLPLLFAAFG